MPRERDAVVREDVRVVLQVMADLRRRALEPRLEPLEHGLAIQLLGRAGIAMRERNVGGLAGRDRERDAHQLGAHVGQARRLACRARRAARPRCARTSARGSPPSRRFRSGRRVARAAGALGCGAAGTGADAAGASPAASSAPQQPRELAAARTTRRAARDPAAAARDRRGLSGSSRSQRIVASCFDRSSWPSDSRSRSPIFP